MSRETIEEYFNTMRISHHMALTEQQTLLQTYCALVIIFLSLARVCHSDLVEKSNPQPLANVFPHESQYMRRSFTQAYDFRSRRLLTKSTRYFFPANSFNGLRQKSNPQPLANVFPLESQYMREVLYSI